MSSNDKEIASLLKTFDELALRSNLHYSDDDNGYTFRWLNRRLNVPPDVMILWIIHCAVHLFRLSSRYFVHTIPTHQIKSPNLHSPGTYCQSSKIEICRREKQQILVCTSGFFTELIGKRSFLSAGFKTRLGSVTSI